MTQPKIVEEQIDLTDAALLGNSTATTQATGNNSTRIATTAFVKNQNYASTTSPSFTGTPTAPTQTSGDDSTKLATTAFVQDAVTAAGAPSTTEVLTATAGAAFGDVGTYAFAEITSNAAGIPGGTTVSGSLLRQSNAAGDTQPTLSGNWRCMGYAYTNVAAGDPARITLWLRIA